MDLLVLKALHVQRVTSKHDERLQMSARLIDVQRTIAILGLVERGDALTPAGVSRHIEG